MQVRSSLSRTALTKQCRLKGLSVRGTRKDLIKRLNQHSNLFQSNIIKRKNKMFKTVLPFKIQRLYIIIFIFILTLIFCIYQYYVLILHILLNIVDWIFVVIAMIGDFMAIYPVYVMRFVMDNEINLFYSIFSSWPWITNNLYLFIVTNCFCIGVILLFKMKRNVDVNISIHHSIFDVLLLFFFIDLQQLFPAILFFVIICLNIWNANDSRIGTYFSMLTEFKIELFHSTMQMLPLSLSIAYYNTNNRFIDGMFILIFISFIYHLYSESNKMSKDADNNTKILKIICLCIMLDYIQIMMLILTKLYLTNDYYFYKFIVGTYPFSAAVIITILFDELWRNGICKIIDNVTAGINIKNIALFCWFILLIFIFLPLAMECINASWIIFVYNEFLSKLRNARDFNETLKDELVIWLQTDKHDILIKVCCINHIKLIKSRNSNPDHLFLEYLRANIESNRYYYRKVTWNGIKTNSTKFGDKHLLQTLKNKIVDYYTMNGRLPNDLRTRWNDFKRDQNATTIHDLLEPVAYYILLGYMFCYAILTLLNIFIWPLITLWIMYQTMDIYQSCFIALYFLLLFVILYKLYDLIKYEGIMWYVIPDLDQLDVNKQDIKAFKEYYKYIKQDRDKIHDALSHIFGNDVANVILMFVPDYICLYEDSIRQN